MRLMTILKGLVVLTFAVVVTAVAILYSTDFNTYKEDIRTFVRDATGRELIIEGDFKPSMGLVPSVVVDRVSFSNAAWGTRKEMVRIEKLRAELELLPAFFGEIRIKQIVLSGADIFLESGSDGIGNWVLDSRNQGEPEKKAAEASDSQIIPSFDKILIEDSRLTWRDGRSGVTSVAKVGHLRVQAEEIKAPLRVDFSGAYDGHPVALNGTIGSLRNIVSGGALPLDLTLSAGGAKLSAKGRIQRPSEGKGIVLGVNVTGENLATLNALTGAALPAIGPYDLTATVIDQGRRWQIKDFTLSVGGSDFAGTILVDPGVQPIGVEASLSSTLLRNIDFRDRDALVSDRTVEKAPASSPRTSSKRVFSEDPLPLEGLRSVNAVVSLQAKQVEAGSAILRDVNAQLSLQGGIFKIGPAKLAYGGGRFSVVLKLMTIGEAPKFDVSFDMKSLDLAEIIKEKGYPGLLTGKVDAEASLSGTGGSVRSIMAGLNGTVELTMNGGRIHKKLLDLLGADALEALSPWSSQDQGIAVKCLVGRYGIRDGKLKSNATVFDTNRLLVTGEGDVNLATEEIDFGVNPTARDVSLLKLIVPLRVGGTLASPSVYPDPGAIARGAVGVAAGIVTGRVIGTVIGNIVSGSSDDDGDNPCLAALRTKATPSDSKNDPKTDAEGKQSPLSGAGKILKGLGEAVEAPANGAEKIIKGVGDGLRAPVEGAGKVIKGVGDGLKDLFGR